jgi:hypothetical protein
LFYGAELGQLGSEALELEDDSVTEDREFRRAGWSSKSGPSPSSFFSWRLMVLLLGLGSKDSRFQLGD